MNERGFLTPNEWWGGVSGWGERGMGWVLTWAIKVPHGPPCVPSSNVKEKIEGGAECPAPPPPALCLWVAAGWRVDTGACLADAGAVDVGVGIGVGIGVGVGVVGLLLVL
jgi:hypothetical protein